MDGNWSGLDSISYAIIWFYFLVLVVFVLGNTLIALSTRGPRLHFWRGTVWFTFAACIGGWFLAAPVWYAIHWATGIYYPWSLRQVYENSLAVAASFGALNLLCCLILAAQNTRDEERV